MEPSAPYSPATHAKADLAKRFVAAFIDGLIGGVVAAVLIPFSMGLGYLLAAAYMLLRDGLAFDFMDGRSVGKKVMKLRPVRLDGGAMDVEASVRRNWPLAAGTAIIGLGALAGGLGVWGVAGLFGLLGWAASLLGLVEAVLVLADPAGRRLGDKTANTQVVEEAA